ncbi:MAG: MFS transporter [Candidatus Diapherotrites archaeon]|nr:MFS transporter [Candidatus Diapherotrites archaeon]
MRLLEGIKRNVVVLGLVSLLNDASSEIIYPLLPLYLASIGVPPAIIGVIEGVAESAASFLKLISGWLSDKFRERKPFVLGGYSMAVFGKLFIALSLTWVHVLLGRFVDRVGKGLRDAPRDAIIAASSDATLRGKVFGFHRMMDTIGAVIGPLVAFILFPLLGFSMLFLAAVVPSVLCVFLVLFFVEEHAPKAVQQWSFELGKLTPDIRRFLLVAGVFALSFFSFAFLILRASELGLPVEQTILVYLLFNVVYAFFAMPAGMMSDALGRKVSLVLGYGLFCAVCLGFAFASSVWHVVFLFALYGIVHAVVDPVQKAFITDMSDKDLRGTSLGGMYAVNGLAALPSSVVAGWLWSSYSSQYAFFFGAAVSGLAALLALLLLRENRRR